MSAAVHTVVWSSGENKTIRYKEVVTGVSDYVLYGASTAKAISARHR